MNRLEINSLRLDIGGRTLLKDLTVTMQRGENWAILGANGSGKTTLLHALAGLRADSRERVCLDGRPLGALPARERARAVSLLFQDYDPGLPATVMEAVLTGRHPHARAWVWRDDNDDRNLARATLSSVSLDGFENRWLPTLSGGERRRAEIAAVLVQQAEICLYDEPTLHLDLHHQVEMLAMLAARPNTLNVFVLHDLNLARRFCRHGLLLFGDGDHRLGPLDTILTPENLERAYRWPMRLVRDGAEVFYLPG
jgi:iron complex transport system ATP-binding protein